MFRGLKINTAILICAAFIFRLLFVNIPVISALNSSHNKRLIKAGFSDKMKRRRQFEALNAPANFKYLAVEICEEESNEDSQSKLHPFVLLQVFYSLVAAKVTKALKKTPPFHTYLSYIPSDRYLVFQVFRI